MRYFLSFAAGLAVLALTMTVLPEQRVQPAHAAQGKSGQAHKTKGAAATAAESGAAPVIREVDLEALKKLLQRAPGKDARPLLINFWATWCEPCREEFPDLIKIKTDYGDSKLELITVSLDDPEELETKVSEFLREMRAGAMPTYLLNVIDPDIVITTIDPEWHGALPATFLYDANGQLVFKHTGRFKTEELRAAIDKVTSGK